MGEISDFQVGQTVQLSDGRLAKIKFTGSTHFAAGDWLGVELDDPNGKNDGAVQGQRYFDCEPAHGMFVRPSVATVLEKSAPNQSVHPQGRTNGLATKGRPPSLSVGGVKRQSILDPAVMKRQSVDTGSPTPGMRPSVGSRLRSPSKSPTKQLGSSLSGNAIRNHTPPVSIQRNSVSSHRSSRPSMLPPSTLSTNLRSKRQSNAGPTNGSVRAPSHTSLSSSRATTNRLTSRPGTAKRLNSVSGESQASMSSGHDSMAESQELEQPSSPVPESQSEHASVPASSVPLVPTLSHAVSFDKSAPSRGRSPPTANCRDPSMGAASAREIEELKTKLRMMEKKRMDDREKMKGLEKLQAERDKFEGIIQKLQTKYQPQQQEIAELKKQLKESEVKYNALEIQQAENETMVEVAALDREMAEETAESLKADLDTLRQRYAEMELEIEILQEENQEFGKEMSPEERTSQGWLQMERSNERLREALMRLKDITQQREGELRGQVAELERDVLDLGNVKNDYLQIKEQLSKSESVIVDLRQQLDVVLGAEEMIEELTEKNFSLNEQLDDLKATIEDLESLKEVNDELEINHTETEKQMQEEIDYKEGLLAEQSRKSVLQDETIHDLEYTVTRFRDLVTNMQSDLEDMRASQQITETEANEMTSRSKAMMDLNMRLQVSASKAQVKAIDLDLRRLEAQESVEHLEIIQSFLPDNFTIERNSVLAFLSFKRISFKASMMHGYIKERVQGQASVSVEDNTFLCCDMLDKLTWISSTCDRFISYIQTSTLEAFARLKGVIYDLEPVERAFSNWIDALKKDELKEAQCVTELQRSIALLSHLSELHITEGLEQYANEIYARALMMQSHLDNAAISLSYVKSIFQHTVVPSCDGEADDRETYDLVRKADLFIMQSRSAKVIAGKAIRQLEDLKTRSLALEPSTLPSIERTQDCVSDIANLAREIGMALVKLVNEEGQNSPTTYEEILRQVSTSDAQLFSSLSSKLNSTATQMQTFYNLTSSLSQTIEFPSPPAPSPWLLLAQKLKDEATNLAVNKSEVGRLKDEIAEKNTAMAFREKLAEELTVKVEVLEKRVGESGGRREKVRELEGIIDIARAKEQDLLRHYKRLQQSVRELESERDSWQKSAQSPIATAPNGSPLDLQNSSYSSPAAAQKIASLESEIVSLQSAVRYLRSASQSHTLASSLSFLSTPLLPPKHAPPTSLQSEAADVFKELLHIVTRPENQLVKLHAVKREDRLRWKPMRETTAWKVGKQKEEWERWKEWKTEVVKKAESTQKEERRKKEIRAKRGDQHQHQPVIAKIQGKLGRGQKWPGEEIRITKSADWDEVERTWGLS